MRNLLIKLLVVLPLAFGAVSCNEEDEYMDITSPFVKFKGEWSGAFTGADTGTFDFSIDDNGKIVGTLKSDRLPNSNFELDGKIDTNGVIIMNETYGGVKIGEFSGKISDFSASGTWTRTSDGGGGSGTWNAGKI